MGLQSRTDKPEGLSYERLSKGQLTPLEEEFLFEYVVPDYERKDENGYGDVIIQTQSPDQENIKISDIRVKSEMLYNNKPFELLFIDHLLLVSPQKWVASTTERLNSVLRDSKQLAMHFNRGQGIPVVGLFQINREGAKRIDKGLEKKKEQKEQGVDDIPGYSLYDLSYANEAERSADIVTSSYLNQELSERQLVLYQCLKSRDYGLFDTFFAKIDWRTKRIFSLITDSIEDGVDTEELAREIEDELDSLESFDFS